MNVNKNIPRFVQLIITRRFVSQTLSMIQIPTLSTSLRHHSTLSSNTKTAIDASILCEFRSPPKEWNRSNSFHSRRKKKHNKIKEKKEPEIPTSSWVYVAKIPKLSNLDDLLIEVEHIMKQELERGILDLDVLTESIEQQQVENDESHDNHNENQEYEKVSSKDADILQNLSMIKPKYWDPTHVPASSDTISAYIPPHMVLEARSCLDPMKRPTGWFLRFPNRSVVHALLEHIKTVSPIHCGHLQVPMYESVQMSPRRFEAEELHLDDTVLRVEQVPHYVTEKNVMNWFQDFDLQYYGNRPPVELLVEGKIKNAVKTNRAIVKTPPHWSINTHTFLVRFVHPSDARAAIREKQGQKVGYSNIVLSQYSRQILQ